MSGKLDGKVAIITGSGAGLGRATAILFAKEGAKVVVNVYNTVKDAEHVVSLIKAAGGEAIYVQADVSKAADVQRMVRTTVDKYGKLDILVNNAAIWEERALLAELREEDWDRTMDVNVKGTFLGMKYAIPEMLKRGGGVIVNLASTSSFIAEPGFVDYQASKSAIIMLNRAAALEYAPKNIRINAIAPGAMKTRMVERAAQKVGQSVDEYSNQWNIPIGRLAEPEEIAKAVLFLASDDASYVIGSIVLVDGGLTIP
jgi:NAD(P)-dependent dehydrogenase (short-subunit alcohol dehydrogenase family)